MCEIFSNDTPTKWETTILYKQASGDRSIEQHDLPPPDFVSQFQSTAAQAPQQCNKMHFSRWVVLRSCSMYNSWQRTNNDARYMNLLSAICFISGKGANFNNCNSSDSEKFVAFGGCITIINPIASHLVLGWFRHGQSNAFSGRYH